MRAQLLGKMRLLSPQETILIRNEGGDYVSGEWVGGVITEIPVKFNIQPFRNNQKRFLLPDGFREEHCLVLYCENVKFQTSEAHGRRLADTFEYGGYTYFVYSDQTWKGYNLSLTEHYAALACRSDVGSVING